MIMHISPCAWYCFDIKDQSEWNIRDLEDRTIVTAGDSSCSIELVAARKIRKAEDVEISEFHENYLRDERILPTKTAMGQNPHKVVTIVTRGVGSDERQWIVCHAFWNNYCAFIKYHGQQRGDMSVKIQTFYDIVNSLQPLALY